MILYLNQLIKLKKYNVPAIFVGYDKSNTKKIWAITIKKYGGKPELDWFMEADVEYYTTIVANGRATPNGRQIVFGKYRQWWPAVTMETEPSKAEIEKYGAYVEEMMEKYKPKEEKHEQES